MKDSVRILGLRYNACHGVFPEEKTLTQPFEIDVEISSDLSAASKSDRLKDTINYSRVVSAVSEVMNGASCRLLERLAGAIIEKICDMIDDGEITVRVRKPRAPIDVPFDTIEIELKSRVACNSDSSLGSNETA